MAQIDPRQFDGGDLRPQLKSSLTHDGKSQIDFMDGVKLTVEVKGNKVAGYTATDTNGNPVPVTPASSGDECWICVQRGDKMICKRVECPPDMKSK